MQEETFSELVFSFIHSQNACILYTGTGIMVAAGAVLIFLPGSRSRLGCSAT
jgi:hypothetical protein